MLAPQGTAQEVENVRVTLVLIAVGIVVFLAQSTPRAARDHRGCGRRSARAPAGHVQVVRGKPPAGGLSDSLRQPAAREV